MTAKKKIIITGANGFLGTEIIRELQNFDCEIFGVIGKSKLVNLEIEGNIKSYTSVDICDPESLKKLENVGNADVLVHAAGLAHQFRDVSRNEFWQVNVSGTKNICHIAKKLEIKHLILISSVSVYGDYDRTLVEEDFDCKPVGFYAESKREAELEAIEFCKKNEIALTILRPATIIGEGDKGNTQRLITNIYRNRFIWIGKGTNKKSLIYKNDAARAVKLIINNERKDLKVEIFNLTAEPVTMQEIVSEIHKNLNKKMAQFWISEKLPMFIFRANSKNIKFSKLSNLETTIKKWLSDDLFSGKKIFDRYGFKVQTPLSEAIRKQVKYFLETKREI